MAGQLGIFLLVGITLFLYYHRSRPYLAGAALLPCTLKPHLFMPFAIALLLWVIFRKAYPIIVGFFAALLVSCSLTLALDHQIWQQYSTMMRTAGALNGWVPTISSTLRFLVDRNAVWLEFIPEVVACTWAVWFFWTRRARWNWLDHGLLALLVSAACAPYAWFTDEAMLIPAFLFAIYRADQARRSMLPFAVLAGIAMCEVIAQVPMTSVFYLWTTPAWLTCYLYSTRDAKLDRIDPISAGEKIIQPA